MSFLDRLIYKDPDGEKQKREEKKTAKQEQQSQVQPLVTGQQPQVYTTQQQVYQPQYGAAPQQYVLAIPPEEMQKCQAYFEKLVALARESNKNYNQFLASLEMVMKSSNQPISEAVKLAFNFLKMQNPSLTKDVLLNDINNALSSIVTDKTTSWKEKQEKRELEGVTNNTKMAATKAEQIKQKQDEINKLNEEIRVLQATAAETKQLIDIKNKCYDDVSAQVTNKIKEEIGLITNYIA